MTKDPFVGPIYVYSQSAQYSNPNLLDAQYSKFTTLPILFGFCRQYYESDSFNNYSLNLQPTSTTSNIRMFLNINGGSVYPTYIRDVAHVAESYIFSMYISASVTASSPASSTFEVNGAGLASAVGNLSAIPHNTRSRVWGSVNFDADPTNTNDDHVYVRFTLNGISTASVSDLMLERAQVGQNYPSSFNIVSNNYLSDILISDVTNNQSTILKSANVTSSKGKIPVSGFVHFSSSTNGKYIQTIDDNNLFAILNDINGKVRQSAYFSRSDNALISFASAGYVTKSTRTFNPGNGWGTIEAYEVKALGNSGNEVALYNDLLPSHIHGHFTATGVGNFSNSSIIIRSDGGHPFKVTGSVTFDASSNKFSVYNGTGWVSVVLSP